MHAISLQWREFIFALAPRGQITPQLALMMRLGSTKRIPKQLDILERLRLNLIDQPRRFEDLASATAVWTVMNALTIFTAKGDVTKVDYLAPLLYELAASYREAILSKVSLIWNLEDGAKLDAH